MKEKECNGIGRVDGVSIPWQTFPTNLSEINIKCSKEMKGLYIKNTERRWSHIKTHSLAGSLKAK